MGYVKCAKQTWIILSIVYGEKNENKICKHKIPPIYIWQPLYGSVSVRDTVYTSLEARVQGMGTVDKP